MLPSCARRLPPDPHGEDAPSRSVLGKHPRDGDAVEPPDAHKAPKQAKQANEPLIRETQQYGDKEQVEQDQEAGGAAQPADCSPGGLENDAGASAEGFEAPEGTNQKAEGSGQNGKEGSHVILERREQKAKDASGSSRMEKGKAAKENEAPGAAAKAMTPEGVGVGAWKWVERKGAEHRILAVVCKTEEEARSGGLRYSAGYGALVDMMASPDEPGGKVEVLWSPSLKALGRKLAEFQPTLLYALSPGSRRPQQQEEEEWEPEGAGEGDTQETLGKFSIRCSDDPESAGVSLESEELVALLMEAGVQATYLDADCSKDVPGQLRKVGLQDVVCWAVQEGESLVVPPPPTGSAASSCSRAFFRALRGLRGSLVREAYSLAMVAMENYPLAPENSGAMIGPSLVSIRSASFPDHTTVPVPLPGSCPVDVSGGISVAVPEWRDIRLIAPRTEVRLLLAGSSELEDPQALEGAARALRSLLVLEVRSANLQASRLSPSRPPYLSPGLDCAACDVTGASGASFPAMVAAPASALRKPWVLALALAHTLAADAMHLQFRVPDVPPPASWAALERDAAPSHRLPATEVVAITSVWAANVLRQYSSGSLPHAARILLSLGVIKVGGFPVDPLAPMDIEHFSRAVTRAPMAKHSGAPAASTGSSLEPKRPKQQRLKLPDLKPPQIARRDYGSKRPPLPLCTKEQLMDDLHLFFTTVLRKPLKLPNLDGTQLDICSMYREVCKRGGFQHRSGINWKGQIFSMLSNWRPGNKQTGVGNSLMNHYKNLLWQYEIFHPEDTASDKCSLCGRGDEGGASDWIACHRCESWVHLQCDLRPGLASFREYVKDGGVEYTCQKCSTCSLLQAAEEAGGAWESSPEAETGLTDKGLARARGLNSEADAEGHDHAEMAAQEPRAARADAAAPGTDALAASGGAAFDPPEEVFAPRVEPSESDGAPDAADISGQPDGHTASS